MEKCPDSQQKWVSRHNNEQSLKLCKTEFTLKNVISTLKSIDNDLFKITKMLYENTIDFGGHPNEKAITQCMKIQKDDRGYLLKQNYLSGDSLFFDNCLKTIFQIGLSSLCIFEKIWVQRFELIGVTEEMNKLRTMLYPVTQT